jgi:exodeoxyribonuclease V alpha subunit
VCLNLTSLDNEPLPKDLSEIFTPRSSSELGEILLKSGIAGKPGEYKPLILDESLRLYLYRYWHYEKTLSDDIKDRASKDIEDFDPELFKKGLQRMFDGKEDGSTNLQKLAAFMSVSKRFSVISGGPGTGKTSVISGIISLILEQSDEKDNRIAFAAPTGKAASRMQDALKKSAKRLQADARVMDSISTGASTIHRLLGSIKNSPYFVHNKENPLSFDTVVVDEVSMVDLPLLSKLLWAVHPDARVILLGDKDQLSSVAPGSVLGDISNRGSATRFSQDFIDRYIETTGESVEMAADPDPAPPIKDCIVHLTRSYRFGPESGIGEVSRAVNEGDEAHAFSILRNKDYPDAGWQKLPSPGGLPNAIRKAVVAGYGPYLEASDPGEALSLFENFRILCVMRQGPYGVLALNRMVESILTEKGMIHHGKRWYKGRPVLISRNDYNLGLFNGDIGIIMREANSKELRAFFPAQDGSYRKLSPERLPEHETVFAMTVHKSQGSEFDRAVFVLPDRLNPVITGELIYTGLTRARKSIEVWGTEGVFLEGIGRRIKRISGLRDALWGKVNL